MQVTWVSDQVSSPHPALPIDTLPHADPRADHVMFNLPPPIGVPQVGEKDKSVGVTAESNVKLLPITLVPFKEISI